MVAMYLWKIEVILKSGKELTVYDKNEFKSSNNVAEKFMAGNQNEVVGFGNKDGTANILVRKNEIAAMTISVG